MKNMEDKIKVSIITVCYNSEKTIQRTIESVLQQTYDNIEYIIVDGKSKDRTMEIAESYKPCFRDMKVISEPDKGIYDAMNKGIDMASGELIGIINSDDFYEENAVETMVNAYERGKHAVYHGKICTVDRTTGAVIGESQTPGNADQLDQGMSISHPTCFIPKATYRKYGKFNTKYSCVADYDLMLRYKQCGEVEFVPVDAVIANFTVGGTCCTHKAFYDLLDMQLDHGMISRKEAVIKKTKAKISELWSAKV
jgi:glycosyltransferase involved in cell wall biosynthesis